MICEAEGCDCILDMFYASLKGRVINLESSSDYHPAFHSWGGYWKKWWDLSIRESSKKCIFWFLQLDFSWSWNSINLSDGGLVWRCTHLWALLGFALVDFDTDTLLKNFGLEEPFCSGFAPFLVGNFSHWGDDKWRRMADLIRWLLQYRILQGSDFFMLFNISTNPWERSFVEGSQYQYAATK